MTALKNDADKPDLSLIPYVAQVAMAEAFMVGLRKYSRFNYCGGMEASRLVSALMRHAGQWFEGEERDPVDGQHHLGSVMACCAMILRQQQLGTLVDNRYKPVPQTAPETWWSVRAIGRLRGEGCQVWFYSSREEAELMAKNFHAKTWMEPHFKLLVEEVANVNAA